MDQFWALPPVARTMFAFTFVQSTLVHGRLVSGYWSIFVPSLIFKAFPEVWRLVTPYFLTRGGYGFIFDLYCMYTYGTALEANSPRFRTSGDFLTYVVFVATVILLLAGILMQSALFIAALLMAFIYTYAQDNRGQKTTFFFVQIRVEHLPWIMLFITWIMAGVHEVMIECCGIAAAHLYDFLTRIYPTFGGGRNYIHTPAFVQRWFAGRGPQMAHGGYKFDPRDRASARTTSSSTGGLFSGGAWGARRPGRRLGGD
ncbi:derlin-2/3 [Coccidioides immitis RS]|uniref:Derlin n=3 Tax=Coccidioides immitis TaxID=5501 RepID=J3K815_COCIM|nr:derlin-2/3 [Coccidioides immitis RS]EAS30897.3 derlin-2/3 [Coccidioides immitis RS]KMP03485.1 hypothetical protein CIRG_03177 [Coccidioides immitis RMSCC 2394]KMU73074.1 hypothetical protein CISG_03335 [Coccidioides immitis RMSCC 3703]TPX23775.1 hypothetical protein DIZ76_013114 [Coccidioides immitis]